MMALTNAEKQRRWRERRNALARSNPETVEHALLQEVERANELSDQGRKALADKLADMAMGYLRRAQEISKLAQKVRMGER